MVRQKQAALIADQDFFSAAKLGKARFHVTIFNHQNGLNQLPNNPLYPFISINIPRDIPIFRDIPIISYSWYSMILMRHGFSRRLTISSLRGCTTSTMAAAATAAPAVATMRPTMAGDVKTCQDLPTNGFHYGWLVVEPYPSGKWWTSSVGMIFHSQYDGKAIKFHGSRSPPTRWDWWKLDGGLTNSSS